MTEIKNKQYALETSYENLDGKEDIIKSILSKFESLLNKEDYYNFQERVYKFNKMVNSVNRHTSRVSNFEEGESVSPSFKNTSNEGNNRILSLENLSLLLDELLKNKDSQEKKYVCLTTSSSEEEEIICANIPIREEKRKKFLRNLYNYELFLKTYLYEKSLTSEKQQMGELANINTAFTTINTVESSNLSINNITGISIKQIESTLINTPSSCKTENESESNKTLNLTPLIKKSFFEDFDVQKINGNRRRSMIEESKSGLAAINFSKRLSGVFESQIVNSYSHKEKKAEISSNQYEKVIDTRHQISNFISSNSNILLNTTQPLPKRSSIFVSREEFLSNIGENDEYCSNFSIEKSLKSDEDSDK